MNAKQIFVIAIIAMFLIVPFASAKQESVDVGNAKQDKKIEEKAVDKTKEQPKEVKNKDKDITGKITVTDSDTSDYSISKESESAIKIKKDGEHTKAKVTIPKEELQKIDEDGDKLYGVIHIAGDGTTTHDIVTESDLIAGIEMTFSENIVNGFTGSYSKTFEHIQPGITRVTFPTSTPSAVTGKVYGEIPSYVAGAIPSGASIILNFNGDTNDTSGNVNILTGGTRNTDMGPDRHGVNSSALRINNTGEYLSYVSSPSLNITGNISMYAWVQYNTQTTNNSKILSKTQYSWGLGNIASKMIYSSISTNAGTKSAYPATNTFDFNRWDHYSTRFNKSGSTIAKNGMPLINSVISYNNITTSSSNLLIGSAFWNGSLDDIYIYPRYLSNAESAMLYAGGSGVSFRPTNSYDFTGYNVAEGIEKSIAFNESGFTSIDIINTGTTELESIVITEYFTEDTTKIEDSTNSTHQLIHISHSTPSVKQTGDIVYELKPLYSGSPVLSSNNPNATIGRNMTSCLIDTGYLPKDTIYNYTVTIQDDHNHPLFLNVTSKWIGNGWDYVTDIPTTWDNVIGHEVQVTVS